MHNYKLAMILIAVVGLVGCTARPTTSTDVQRAVTLQPTAHINTPELAVRPTTPVGVVSTQLDSVCSESKWNVVTTINQNSVPQVFLLSSVSGEILQVTSGTNSNVAAGWSPSDKCKILVVSDAGLGPGYSEVFALNLANLRLDRITFSGGQSFSPKWSPDGRSIAYTRRVNDINQVFVINSDGSAERQVTFGGLQNVFADWSPKGDAVLYVGRSADKQQEDIYITYLFDNKPQKLTSIPGRKWQVNWSITSNRISFFSGDIDAGTGDVYILSTNPLNLRLAVKTVQLFENVWSPDGEELIFSGKYVGSDHDDFSRLYSISMSSLKVQHFLPDQVHSLAMPSYSPDANNVAFRSDFAVAILDTHNQAIERFDNIPVSPYPLYWRPLSK